MFRTLEDYKKTRKYVDEEELQNEYEYEETTDSYAGGKESGIAVQNPDDNKRSLKRPVRKITIQVYKNGFIVDNKKFRPFTTPENQKFIEEIDRGYIPNEFSRQGFKKMRIDLQEYRDQVYKESKDKKFEAFQGKGQNFGGISVSTQDINVDSNVESNVDKSKPTCKITIRLANGEIINGEFNVTQVFRDVFIFVSKSSGINTFRLLSGFPPKPITEMRKTIEELGIQGSMLTQSAN